MSFAKSWQLNVFELKINWKKLEITNRLSRITSKEVRSESYSRVLYKYKQTEHHWIPIHTRTHIHRDRQRERESCVLPDEMVVTAPALDVCRQPRHLSWCQRRLDSHVVRTVTNCVHALTQLHYTAVTCEWRTDRKIKLGKSRTIRQWLCILYGSQAKSLYFTTAAVISFSTVSRQATCDRPWNQFWRRNGNWSTEQRVVSFDCKIPKIP